MKKCLQYSIYYLHNFNKTYTKLNMLVLKTVYYIRFTRIHKMDASYFNIM